jgi:hypothetical protein
MAARVVKCVQWLAVAALLSASLACACAQGNSGRDSANSVIAAATGSLAGRLTDLRSKPLGGVTVVLRNELTGTESRTTTAKNGAYRLTGLAPGEYTLEAESPQLGQGRVEGIAISDGFEAHVMAAVELEPAAAPNSVTLAATRIEPQTAPRTELQAESQTTPQTELKPAPLSVKSAIAPQPERTPELAARTIITTSPPPASPQPAPKPTPLPQPTVTQAPAQPAVLLAKSEPPILPSALPTLAAPPAPNSLAATPVQPSDAEDAAEMDAAISRTRALVANFRSLQSAMRANPAAASAALDSPPISAAGATISGEELSSLPVSGRNWQQFLADSPPAGNQTSGTDGSNFGEETRAANAVTVDGANLHLAFGGRNSGSSQAATRMSTTVSETAVGAVAVAASGSPASGERTRVETRSGGPEIHGEGFLFAQQNLWGAQNPFSQWVQQTAPATATTVPTFTASPLTPANHETTWGASAGGPLRRYRMSQARLFWFGALEGSERNDPGVAAVKHADDFFAQPTNDEMQVLSARLGLSATNPVPEGVAAYSTMLESLAGLLGPAPRSSNQWSGFGRIDWNESERHRFTLEGSGARMNAPGAGLTSASETYGSHSFGGVRMSDVWLLGRWEAFLTPNLLAVTQGSLGQQMISLPAETPSAFEQAFDINAWGQLPQMVVDSRYGFTIGNPSRFGSGSYPDEHLYEAQEGLDWVRGKLMVKAGFDLRHNGDATSLLRNHTGTYNYSRVENFVSDALVFAQYGINGELNPDDQHNCDQRGKAWRNSAGQLEGLGYLPCYSSYSQTLGPTEWHLSTNDWAGFATAQWQPTKWLALTGSLRWEREQMPPPIALVNNPDLPLTEKLPATGNQWAPRVSLAWGTGAKHWPVLQLGYGLYYGRTTNSVLETALTQTGSLNGDLNFFFRPTDNLEGNGGGAPPFPYVLAGQPASFIKPGAVEFAPRFRNPEIHQAVAGVEETLPGRVKLSVTAEASLGRRLPVTIDTNLDPTTNPGTITYAVNDSIGAGPIKTPQITVPFYASWPSTSNDNRRLNPNYQQIVEIMSRANSTYEAGTARLSRSIARNLNLELRYTYAHVMDWNPDETAQVSGPSVLDPNDFAAEYGTSNLDMRHAVSGTVFLESPRRLKGTGGRLANGWTLATTGHYRSGLPYTMRVGGGIPEEFLTSGATIVGLGSGLNGYGGDNRLYSVGRNTYRYPATWEADVRLARRFLLPHGNEMELMAQSFNLFNHQNVTEVETTGYYIEPGYSGDLPTLNFMTGIATSPTDTNTTEFGKPLNVNATDYYRPRQIEFGVRLSFRSESDSKK